MSTKPINLTGNDVLDIFNRRAGGATLEEIADKYPFSTVVVADVLHRRRRSDVLIPEKIFTAVQESFKVRVVRKRKALPSLVPVHMLLAQFTAAAHELNLLRRRCVQAGVPMDTLDLLQESTKVADGINREGTG
jgi:hypothetical protein